MSAVVDGLSIQAGLMQEGFDPGVALKTFLFLIGNSLGQLEPLAAASEDSELELSTVSDLARGCD